MYEIRDFNETDYSSLIALWKDLELGRPERGDNLQTIRNTLALGGRLLVLSDEQQKIVGSAWLTNNGRRLYLHHMGVSKLIQGQGYGKKLMSEIMRIARELKMQIKLEVHQTNTIASHLYQEFGFEPLSGYDVLINRSTSL
jgi:ribosomal protein S18 acetylase RimI-like enzyme